MKSFKLEILTPLGHYFTGEVNSLVLSNDDFVLGILPGHAPLITTVAICEMKLVINGNTHYYAIGEGVLNIKKDITKLMVNSIEKNDEIDLDRAKRAYKRATDRANSGNEFDLVRNNKALKRANIRIKVAEERK